MSHRERVERHPESSDGCLMVGAIGVVFLGLFLLLQPTILKARKKSDASTSISNAKQVGILMLEFDLDFGAYPNDQTAEKKEILNEYVGEYSNDYLGQLLAGGYIDSEEIFYAKWGSGSKNKPDNVYSTKEKTLEEGECGFAYIKGLRGSDKAKTPVLLTAMYGDGYKFDPYAYKGKAMVLRVDGSAVGLKLDKEGNAMLPDGKTLFEGGAESVWGEEGFDKSNLCYAKYPYTPKKQFDVSAGAVETLIFCTALGIYLLFCLILLFRKLKRAKRIG